MSNWESLNEEEPEQGLGSFLFLLKLERLALSLRQKSYKHLLVL